MVAWQRLRILVKVTARLRPCILVLASLLLTILPTATLPEKKAFLLLLAHSLQTPLRLSYHLLLL